LRTLELKKYLQSWIYDGVTTITKEGDEWKVAFTIPEQLFELMVMFFDLTNLLATF